MLVFGANVIYYFDRGCLKITTRGVAVETSKKFEGMNPFLEANKAAKKKMQKMAAARTLAAGAWIVDSATLKKESQSSKKRKAVA